MQSFTARMPLLAATSAFRLARRRWSSPQHSTVLSTTFPWRCLHCCLGGRNSMRPVKKLSGTVQTWLSVWPSWCHCHSLASVKSRLVLPFWYRLTWVDPVKWPLNVCVCFRGAQKNDYTDRASWFGHILQFLKRTCICSAYHWTNSKLATVSWVTMPCQTQTITLLLLEWSNHHHQQHYATCYKREMYHLCQYEDDTSSANCKHNNINTDALLPDSYHCRIHTGWAKKDCFWEMKTL